MLSACICIVHIDVGLEHRRRATSIVASEAMEVSTQFWYLILQCDCIFMLLNSDITHNI